jgi:nitroreductase
MSARFTCRAYRPEAVPDDLIRSIAWLARRSASWCNVQPWQLVVTSGESTERFRQALTAHASVNSEVDSDLPFPPGYEGVYGQRRKEAGLALYEALGITRQDNARRASQSFENFRLFGAPHVAILTIPEALGPYAAVDAGGFIASFLLAAQAHGVATTPQAALARHAGFIRRHFSIDEGQRMVCAISFGYADRDHPVNRFRTSRAAVDEILRLV